MFYLNLFVVVVVVVVRVETSEKKPPGGPFLSRGLDLPGPNLRFGGDFSGPVGTIPPPKTPRVVKIWKPRVWIIPHLGWGIFLKEFLMNLDSNLGRARIFFTRTCGDSWEKNQRSWCITNPNNAVKKWESLQHFSSNILACSWIPTKWVRFDNPSRNIGGVVLVPCFPWWLVGGGVWGRLTPLKGFLVRVMWI